jgi:NAD(P)-dependent dehydrogenase (short-subunit alcohol dehydrogenase family)
VAEPRRRVPPNAPIPVTELADRSLLITGTTGIAAETARRAATEGARVFVVGIDATSGEELAAEIAGAGGECRFFHADVTDAARVAAAVGACATAFGRIDAVFNVVGISGRRFGDGPLHECTEEGWEVTFASNVKSMFLVCREALRRMLEQEPGGDGMRGAVLNMASVLAFSPEPRFFATHAYAASKGAVLAMSRSIAAYYAPHKIRVNALAPSLVRTPMSRRAQVEPQIVDLVRRKQPLVEDLLDAADVANAALFLLGGRARAITGETLTVDAGWSVGGSWLR